MEMAARTEEKERFLDDDESDERPTRTATPQRRRLRDCILLLAGGAAMLLMTGMPFNLNLGPPRKTPSTVSAYEVPMRYFQEGPMNETDFRANLMCVLQLVFYLEMLMISPGVRYITANVYDWEGMTNQFMSLLNLLYLAAHTKRVAILPNIEPGSNHHGAEVWARWSDLYDLDHFQRSSGIPAIEWTDILPMNAQGNTSYQTVGCFQLTDLWWRGQLNTGASFQRLGLFPQLYPLPQEIKARESPGLFLEPTDFVDFDRFARSEYTADLVAHKEETINSQAGRYVPDPMTHPPTDDLFCLDGLFYVIRPIEQLPDFFPRPTNYSHLGQQWTKISQWESYRWLSIGQHLRHSPQLEQQATLALEAVGVPLHARYIAIHLRRGDFVNTCQNCLQGHAEQVQRLRDALVEQKGWTVKQAAAAPVVVMTNEKNRDSLQEITDRGWILVDHDKLKTADRFGEYYAVFIDEAILSRANAVLGTVGSTFSWFAARRAITWNDAVALDI